MAVRTGAGSNVALRCESNEVAKQWVIAVRNNVRIVDAALSAQVRIPVAWHPLLIPLPLASIHAGAVRLRRDGPGAENGLGTRARLFGNVELAVPGAHRLHAPLPHQASGAFRYSPGL